jgi:hypothetical protein
MSGLESKLGQEANEPSRNPQKNELIRLQIRQRTQIRKSKSIKHAPNVHDDSQRSSGKFQKSILWDEALIYLQQARDMCLTLATIFWKLTNRDPL